MAEPFKNLVNPKMIKMMALHFKKVWPPFDEKKFIKHSINNLENLELKQRSENVKTAMEATLPKDFKKSAKILVASLHPEDNVNLSKKDMDQYGIRGWATIAMSEYVGEHGLDNFELGMSVQKEITKRGTAEFGVRNYINHDYRRALGLFSQWSGDNNFHVRRLVSESLRPRLPWARKIQRFIENPDPVIKIIARLKDDPEEYVRRSVANNINDISKDHPEKIAKLAKEWSNNSTPERDRLIRHGCRSLIKQGHQKTLSVLGYKNPKIKPTKLKIMTPVVKYGSALQFKLKIRSTAQSDQRLIIDYIIHHRKSNGKTAPKVFKWKTINLKAGETIEPAKRHLIKPITTRAYYGGIHGLEIMVNGQIVCKSTFELKM